MDPLAEEVEERGAGVDETELALAWCSREVPGAAVAGRTGVRRGRSDNERRRRIISAETRHSGEEANEGSAGDGGPLLLLLVLLLLFLLKGTLSSEGSELLDREGRENERERRLPRGSGSVSISIDLDVVSRVLSSEAMEAWKRDQARRSSHFLTSLPKVSKTESSRIRSYSFLRLCRSCALADRTWVR